MDYSKLVESLKKKGSNRICFDCGDVGTTYASLNFGTFVCSRCAGILRGLNFKVKPLGISIFTLNEYEILSKNGNDKARNIWLALYDPFKHEKPNPKNYDDVKKHIINKYKEKKYYKDTKGIHFINQSIEEDINDPLELVNKCKIKKIDIGPLWTKKKADEKNDENNGDNKNKNNNRIDNDKIKKINENNNMNKNVDLLGGLLDSANIDNQNNTINNSNKKVDINDLFEGFNFNNDNENKINKLNNMINNMNNNDLSNINNKGENNLEFNFGSFSNNLPNENDNINNIFNSNQKKKDDNWNELQDENLGFDFGDENSNHNNLNNGNNNENNINDKATPDNIFNNIKNENNNILDFEFNDNNNKNHKENNNFDLINMYENKQDNLLFNFDNQNQKNNNNNIFDDNLGFDFGSEENQKKENNNNINNNNLGLNFDFENEKNILDKTEQKNINSLFGDPNTEQINDMKINQEIKRNDNFQSLTIALDNQNKIDKINQESFNFS